MQSQGALPKPERGEELKLVLEAERTGMPFLVYRLGDGTLSVFVLDQERVLIGRLESSDVMIDWDDQVSRVHAELERAGDAWVAEDDGLSTNGTFVGDEKVVGKRVLHDGDIIRLGRSLVAFRDPSGSVSRGPTVKGESIIVPDLTNAQMRVLNELCRPVLLRLNSNPSSATNQEIADVLFLSLDAVKGHLRVLYSKFGIEDLPRSRKREALVEKAIESGVANVSRLES